MSQILMLYDFVFTAVFFIL